MRAMITVFAAALLMAVGCAKKDNATGPDAAQPMDQPADTAPATPPSPAPAEPTDQSAIPPPPSDTTTPPPSDEATPPTPPQQ